MTLSIDINHTPALAAPEGVTSNLVNPYSTHRWLVFTAALCLTFSLLGITGRVFTKAYVMRKTQLEDYALVFAGIGFSAFTGVMLAAGHAGQGRHQWDVSIAGVQRVAYLANILEIVYPPTMFAAKLAILLQIKRIFTAHQKDLTYWSVLILIYANLLTYFACFVAFIFACWPREKIWNPHVPGKCISTNASIIATSVINVISDLTILLLPIHGVMKLHISLRKKIGVGAIFATGVFACVSSVIRLVYSIRLTQTQDITWAIAPVGMWALAEFATVILVACFPMLPRLFQFAFKKGLDSKYKYAYGSEPDRKLTPARKDDTTATWYGDQARASKGSYIPLEDRKTGSEADIGGQAGHTAFAPAHTANSGIYRKVEVELVSHPVP